MKVNEVYINATRDQRFGESGPYEPYTTNIGKLFRSYQKEFGRCTSKVYIDTDQGPKAIGWVFIKTMKYEDARSKNDIYVREVWVTIHKGD